MVLNVGTGGGMMIDGWCWVIDVIVIKKNGKWDHNHHWSPFLDVIGIGEAMDVEELLCEKNAAILQLFLSIAYNTPRSQTVE